MSKKKLAIIASIVAVVAIALTLGTILIYYSGSYIVTYDLNGGEMEETETRVWFDDEYELPTPTKNGYSFAGWYYGDVHVKKIGIWQYKQDVTLKAKWEIRDENGVVYRKTEDGYIVESYKGLAKDIIIIPEVYNKIPIVGMDEAAFHNMKDSMTELKTGTLTIYVPETITDIGDKAEFDSNVKIKRYSYIEDSGIVYLDNGDHFSVVGYVGDYSKSITIPSVYREKPVKQIADYAFFGASFDFDSWFVYVSNIAAEISDKANTNNKIIIKYFNETDENGLMYAEEPEYYTVVGYNGDYKKDIVVPFTYKDKPVKEIGDNAFYGLSDRIGQQTNSFFRILIPEDIKIIGKNAFGNCNGIKVSLYYMKGEDIREITNLNMPRLYSWIIQAIIDEGNDDLVQVITQICPAFGWGEYSNAKYYVCLNANGGEITVDGKKITEIVFTKGKSYSLPTPTRAGYTFDGWYYGETLVSPSGANWMYKSYIGLTAKWIEE